MLEMEVLHLEKYLVSLYQKAIDRRIASVFKDTTSDQEIPPNEAINKNCLEEQNNEAKEQEEVLGSSIHRSHSSLSHHSAYPTQLSPLAAKVTDAVNSYHSLPLTLLEVNTCGFKVYSSFIYVHVLFM